MLMHDALGVAYKYTYYRSRANKESCINHGPLCIFPSFPLRTATLKYPCCASISMPVMLCKCAKTVA
ncbi:uncharacterized protein LACBIDRAFT_308048 [Laccaria bicolor S238N-H82]|uniref:Predicted protein n=1 Tax=Laccaria bicolor (strain S238N-H82 / ATCC MYA-4686) TaxID=486041 RepID=B0DRI4_LACBS|nr:uncharacterized protein LACBIDRAFT_308048 [Laccaria bicolor S238N-H82]EDR02789.1 predicted protein [Laccaria bicolor S238N-H82]|eukprot:XP_001886499.1 predicted protein [Laccaria bicolor S238N-H82]